MKLDWHVLVILAAAVQLAGVAAYCAFSRRRFPKSGLRGSERLLLGSAAIVIVASLAITDFRALWTPRANVQQAAAVPSASQGSCALIDTGMAEAEVVRRLGQPDQRVSDEETRGPGAVVLVYKGSRCAVHLFEGRVELVD